MAALSSPSTPIDGSLVVTPLSRTPSPQVPDLDINFEIHICKSASPRAIDGDSEVDPLIDAHLRNEYRKMLEKQLTSSFGDSEMATAHAELMARRQKYEDLKIWARHHEWHTEIEEVILRPIPREVFRVQQRREEKVEAKEEKKGDAVAAQEAKVRRRVMRHFNFGPIGQGEGLPRQRDPRRVHPQLASLTDAEIWG